MWGPIIGVLCFTAALIIIVYLVIKTKKDIQEANCVDHRNGETNIRISEIDDVEVEKYNESLISDGENEKIPTLTEIFVEIPLDN